MFQSFNIEIRNLSYYICRTLISSVKILLKNLEMSEFIKPTEAELEILHILWENGPQSVPFSHLKLIPASIASRIDQHLLATSL